MNIRNNKYRDENSDEIRDEDDKESLRLNKIEVDKRI